MVATEYELAPCPACGAEAASELADREALRREMETLWEFHLRRLRVDVPVERLFDRVVFSQQPALRLARCSECGTVYRNPREDAETAVELYEDEETDPGTLESLHHAQRRAYREQARRLTGIAGGPGRGLEVGSYVGGFLGAAAALGWSFEGIDVNATAARFARGTGLTVRAATIEEVVDEHFDAVAIWNCFDQLPDPHAAVRAAHRLLLDGGIVAIRVPNGDFYARWRRLLDGPSALAARRVLAHNNLLGFPYRHGFTPDSLRRLLVSGGFEVVSTRGDALLPLADGWTRAWAAIEERAVKRALRLFRSAATSMPWFEVYARRR